eukprot:gene25795-62862_t
MHFSGAAAERGEYVPARVVQAAAEQVGFGIVDVQANDGANDGASWTLPVSLAVLPPAVAGRLEAAWVGQTVAIAHSSGISARLTFDDESKCRVVCDALVDARSVELKGESSELVFGLARLESPVCLMRVYAPSADPEWDFNAIPLPPAGTRGAVCAVSDEDYRSAVIASVGFFKVHTDTTGPMTPITAGCDVIAKGKVPQPREEDGDEGAPPPAAAEGDAALPPVRVHPGQPLFQSPVQSGIAYDSLQFPAVPPPPAAPPAADVLPPDYTQREMQQQTGDCAAVPADPPSAPSPAAPPLPPGWNPLANPANARFITGISKKRKAAGGPDT